MPWLNSCLCSPDDKPKPSVSAPLHLLIKGESSDSQCHAFRTKQFKKARPCNLCHQPILNQGSSCRVCKYVCHKSCEDKATDKHHGLEAPSPRTPSSLKQDDKERWRSSRRKGTGMDLSYVTERILALWFPQETSQDAFVQGHRDAATMLHGKHPNSYMLFNLSEGCWEGGQSEHERTAEMGWSKDLAPPLDRLCAVCKEMDSWLSADPSRIAVLHARGSKERIGVVVAAYMHYSSICGSPEQALDRFAMKRFLDHKIGDLELPSNRRYVEYFSGLLSGSIRINSASLYLTHVTVLGAPAFERCGSGCRAFIKVYEGLVPVYTSGVHTVSGDTRQFTVNVANQHRKGLQLRGDILIKCYHRHYCSIDDDVEGSPLRCSSPEPPIYRELIFACQFHTCAVSDHTLSFTRNQLDSACNDLRFPLDGAVELHFGARGEARTLPAPTPAVPVDTAPDPVTAWDSLQHLENIVSPPSTPPDSDRSDDQHNPDCLSHTYGPVDGSLYATVAKKDSLSMDSGISSAGNGLLASKPHQPVQSEVGADLDRLLDEMLMTVRDIPDLDVPYHARSDSRPFTYGALSSPGLVRKASIKRSQSSGPPVPASPRSPDFHEGNVVSGSAMRGEGSWLQRQQAKLRERREANVRWDRAGLLWELKSSPSRRPDGYASDTTHLDDDDLTDFGRPMLANSTATRPGSAPVSPLLPHRSSSRQANRHTKERAFVHLRRSRESTEKERYNDLSPDGVDASTDSGLISLAGSSGVTAQADTLSCLMESLSAGHDLTATSQHSASNSSDDNNTADTWPHGQLEHQLRDESSGWRSGGSDGSPTHTSGSPRPNTPAFPVYPRTPYSNNSTLSHSNNFDTLPPKSPTISRKEWSSSLEGTLTREHSTVSSLRGYESSDNQHCPKSPLTNGSVNGIGGGSPSPTVYYGHSRRSSIHSNGEPPTEVSPAHVKFVRDTSRYWYKPTISREEAISLLRDRSPGTFVVRDSNSFPGAFGLALKVATPPPGTRPTGDPSSELVRHFLIEPTSRGVKLKGCQNEPVFSSLSALVYQHSVTPLALPCRLFLPETDLRLSNEPAQSTAHMLLTQGAACNVLYLTSVETESLTGPQAVNRAVECFFSNPPTVAPAVVHFKVSSQGITLTDNKRQIFFRRHYPVASISYCGLDPDDRRFEYRAETTGLPHASLRVFGFVARKPASGSDNQCHVFAELEPEQPATAIVNFVSKVMMSSTQAKTNIV